MSEADTPAPLPPDGGMADPDDPTRPLMRGNRRVLCHVSEIGEAGRGFTLTRIVKDKPEAVLPILVVPDHGDDGQAVQCYMNVCPHQGTRLEMKADTFLDVEREHIQCSTHAAKFRIADGYCLKGPCVGQSLSKLPVSLDSDGMVLFGA